MSSHIISEIPCTNSFSLTAVSILLFALRLSTILAKNPPSSQNKSLGYSIIKDNKSDRGFAQWEESSYEDLTEFFNIRQKELRQGGAIFFELISFNEDLTEDQSKFESIVNQGARKVLSEVLVKNDFGHLDEKLTMGQVYRDHYQYKKYFEQNQQFNLVQFKAKTLDFPRNVSREDKIKEAINHLRSYSELTYLSLMMEHLNDEKTAKKLLGMFYDNELKEYFDKNIDEYPSSLPRLLLVAEKCL